MADRRTSVLLVLLLGLLAACAGAGDPAPADTSSPGGASPPAAPSTPPTSPSPEPTASPDASPAAALPGGHVLVASDRGVDLLTPDGESRVLTSLPAVSAYDDGAGGVVLQGLEPPGPNPPSAAVMWLPPDGGDAVTVVDDGAADEVRLWDAGTREVQAVAVLTMRTDADSVTDSTQTLQAIALPNGESTDLAVTGGWESGARLVTYGDQRVGVHWSGEGETTFALLDSSGEAVPARANPLEEPRTCLDEPGCPSAVGVASDGDRLAWLEAADDGHRLIVQAVDADEPEHVLDLPSALVGEARVEDVRLAGDLAVVNRVADADDADVLAALLVDLASGEVDPLALAGRAAPTRG